MIYLYLKSFFRRIRLKSAIEFSLLAASLLGLLTLSGKMFLLTLPAIFLFLLTLSWWINWLASKKKTFVPCKICSFPHCDFLFPERSKKKNPSTHHEKGSFACSSFDHAHYPDIYYCPRCYNGFLLDMANHNYEKTKALGDELYKEVRDEEYIHHIEARYITYESLIGKYHTYFANKDLLEIGCYYGAFYEKVRGVARSYQGVEPSRHACQFLREKYSTLTGDGPNQIFNGLLEEAIQENILQNNSYDTIVLFDVLEHLPNPRETLMALHSLLRKGGHIIYSTINIEAVISLSMGPYWPWFMDMHYYYFSDRGYRELFKQSGFTLLKHAHFPYTVTCQYFLSKVFTLFMNRPFPELSPEWKKWLSFTIPMKLGDTVLIIGEKQDPLQGNPSPLHKSLDKMGPAEVYKIDK